VLCCINKHLTIRLVHLPFITSTLCRFRNASLLDENSCLKTQTKKSGRKIQVRPYSRQLIELYHVFSDNAYFNYDDGDHCNYDDNASRIPSGCDSHTL